ncbi:hypothetical protein GCM10010430_01860 [Kitasatospora cystarginea]|uniref:Uncharacterized protein n=1 Tax=Kitasatospora cystarginea TaxID=58350 RepID=A0ABP5Q670_9ACTN
MVLLVAADVPRPGQVALQDAGENCADVADVYEGPSLRAAVERDAPGDDGTRRHEVGYGVQTLAGRRAIYGRRGIPGAPELARRAAELASL